MYSSSSQWVIFTDTQNSTSPSTLQHLYSNLDGSLIIKILKRTAEFRIETVDYNTRPVERQGTLQIPKKTKVFVEQTIRERENAPGIYNNFLTELWRLRLTAARETVDVINSAESTISGDIGHAPIKLSAEVCGLGPIFRLFLTIENMSAHQLAGNLAILLHADHRHYHLEQAYCKVSFLTYLESSPIRCKKIYFMKFFCHAVAVDCAGWTIEIGFPDKSRGRCRRWIAAIRFDAGNSQYSRHDTKNLSFETVAGRYRGDANARDIPTRHLLIVRVKMRFLLKLNISYICHQLQYMVLCVDERDSALKIGRFIQTVSSSWTKPFSCSKRSPKNVSIRPLSVVLNGAANLVHHAAD